MKVDKEALYSIVNDDLYISPDEQELTKNQIISLKGLRLISYRGMVVKHEVGVEDALLEQLLVLAEQIIFFNHGIVN
ncbi:hypothetical protein CCR75_009756 [Bremia lactucae]|uniref:Uncharacterized protein n=1 Tax=Bremia lactucae TaxID=4779 RepID=A0A976FSM8_BRELC|nr:hypothetical protein CCR75_009756 [Bremia lactucae]